MKRFLSCLIGLHQWWWFSLHDPEEMDVVRISQCVCCGKIAGGWRGGKGSQ